MITQKDKLSIFHRLTREGRWRELEPAKDRRIKQLRCEGLSRSDAHDKAWHELAENNPPLTQKQIDCRSFLKALTWSEFPPDYDDEPNELRLADLFFVLVSVLVCQRFADQLEVCRGYTDHVLRSRVVIDAPTTVSRWLGCLYVVSPARFLELARDRLSVVVDRCDETVKSELDWLLEATERLLCEHKLTACSADEGFDTKRQADLIVMSLEEALN